MIYRARPRLKCAFLNHSVDRSADSEIRFNGACYEVECYVCWGDGPVFSRQGTYLDATQGKLVVAIAARHPAGECA